jgi:hypothetical protein
MDQGTKNWAMYSVRIQCENKKAFDAVKRNDVAKMENIFQEGDIEQEAIDLFMFDILNVQMLKLFLRFGGDIHKLGPPMVQYPYSLLLHYTRVLMKKLTNRARRQMVELIQFLIEEGVDLNYVDHQGVTAFLKCAENGPVALCKLFVEKGANPKTPQNDKSTALHSAARFGSMEVIIFLVEECGLDLDVEMFSDGFSTTPLYHAAEGSRPEVCEYLLKKGALINKGYQPLIGAAGVYYSQF